MLIQDAMGFRHCTVNVTTAFTGHGIHDGATGAEQEVVLHQMCSICDAQFLLQNTIWLCNDAQLQHMPTNSALLHHNTKQGSR